MYRQEVLRCELEEHRKINQIQHLESMSIFAICEMEQLKQMNIQQTKTNIQLTITNKQLTERVTTLENEVERLSYPIILRDEIAIPLPMYIFSPSHIKEVNWKFLKIRVEFKNTCRIVMMENDDTRAPHAKWPFEGRFKLTTIDKSKSHIYESDFIKLQPRNVSKDKGQYPSQFLLAEIPYEDSQEDIKFKFTLQIQEIENQ